MDAKLFRRLETCNAEESWAKVKDVITIQLMGDDIIPVPFLREAENFSLGHMILKERCGRVEKMTGVIPTALPVGPFSKFVTMTPENDLMQRLGNVQRRADAHLNQSYEFHESDMKHGVKKEITVQLWACQQWAIEYTPKPGEIVLDMVKTGYKDFDRVYLITECFYVTEAKIQLTIADKQDTYLIKGQIPVGFKMVKYKLHPNGTLGTCKQVSTRKWRVNWIKGKSLDEHEQGSSKQW
ncbi:uncharacterized protein C11orf42-like [Mya arenaria]|uniref:uncharacterized protein C11orf42-like n=1 Tax=Mya arenaria TaxID=6604 RepID=UPI0022DFCF04|nr:uncharacterized protein C11orf42-like [Mya arenaria]